MAAAVAALAVSALGVPAAAAGSGKVMIVQGRPGPAVDVCINRKEVKSRLAYGKKAFKKLGAGKKTLKVFKKDPRRCRGVLLSKKSFAFPGGSDLTIVITQKKPKKIIVFDNAGAGVLPAFGNVDVSALRYAADIGPVAFKTDVDKPDKNPVAPVWAKGDKLVFPSSGWIQDAVRTIWVTRPDSDTTVFGPHSTYIELSTNRRYEWILVGTKIKNLKFVTARRLVTFH